MVEKWLRINASEELLFRQAIKSLQCLSNTRCLVCPCEMLLVLQTNPAKREKLGKQTSNKCNEC